jgi:hypothetical protein
LIAFVILNGVNLESQMERRIGRDLEGNGLGLTEVLSRCWPGTTEEDNEELHSGYSFSRPRIESRTSRIQL